MQVLYWIYADIVLPARFDGAWYTITYGGESMREFEAVLSL
jgi:hypothetical protein